MAEPAAKSTEKPTPKKSQHLWITNNEDRIRILALRPKMQSGSDTMSVPENFILPPGATVAERAPWERWKAENPDESVNFILGVIQSDEHKNRRQERAGQPVLVEGPDVEDKKFPLKGIDQSVARALIPEIRDERLLRQIRNTVKGNDALFVTVNEEIEKMERAARRPAA